MTQPTNQLTIPETVTGQIIEECPFCIDGKFGNDKCPLCEGTGFVTFCSEDEFMDGGWE